MSEIIIAFFIITNAFIIMPNKRTLISFAQEVNAKAESKGHNMVWNTNDPNIVIGRCACGLRSDITLDDSEALKEEGVLKQCRLNPIANL